MSAAEILKLIETVDPNDTVKLDEIDFRVEVFLGRPPYPLNTLDGSKYVSALPGEDFIARQVLPYTRSRDALKAIRPEGWVFVCQNRFAQAIGPDVEYSEPEVNYFEHTVLQSYLFLPTEELAELHAIIQAIEYERNKND